MTYGDPIEGERRKQEALDRVERNARAEWNAAAWVACRAVIERRYDFTTDDIWMLLDTWGAEKPREPRAMGAITAKAIRRGLIYRAPVFARPSVRPQNHRRPITVWRPA